MRSTLFSLMFSLSLSLDAEPLTWFVFDLPPLHVLSGEDQGRGQLDGHDRFLIRHLKHQEVTVESANIARILAEARAGRAMAASGFLKTAERQQYLYFSIPFLVAPLPQLAVRTDEVSRLKEFRDETGTVDLRALLAADRFTIGLIAGRSYGQVVDSLVAAKKDSPRIVFRSASSDLSRGQLAMLKAGHLDFVVVFPRELEVYNRQDGASGPAITMVPVLHSADVSPIFVVTPRTPAGLRLITEINSLIRTYWNDPEFRATAFYQTTATEQANLKQFFAAGPQADPDY